jgi:methyl-accepting chemotaxis protein
LLFFALVALLLVALGLFSLAQMSVIRKSGTEVEAHWMASQATADGMAISFARVRTESLRQLAFKDPETFKKSDTLVTSSLEEIKQSMQQYVTLIATEEERQFYKAALEAFQQYTGVLAERQRVMARDPADPAMGPINAKLTSVGPIFNEKLAALRSFNQAGAKQAEKQAFEAYSQARVIVIAVILVALAATIILALILTKSIVTPIRQAVRLSDQIAEGDLSHQILLEGNDEATQMLRSLSRMQDNLRQTIGQIGDSAHMLSASAEEMSALMEESTLGLQRQNDQIEMAATAVNEMTAAVEDVAENAVSTSEASRVSSESA